jgi:hypothetical protein
MALFSEILKIIKTINPSAPIAMEILRFLAQIVMESGNCNSK